MSDDELERFKRIDLRVYAASQGYQLDKRESWRGSAVMRHPNNDKIVIKRSADGHYVYFSVRDDKDNGSIIDFVQHRDRVSLGVVRKILRPWIGVPPVPVPAFPVLHKTSKDRLRVEAEFAKMQEATRIPIWKTNAPCPLRCSPRSASPAVFGSMRAATRSSRISTRKGSAAMKSRTATSRASLPAEARACGYRTSCRMIHG